MLAYIEDWDATSDRNGGNAKRPRERESAPDELPIFSEPSAHGDRHWWHATENGARHRECIDIPRPDMGSRCYHEGRDALEYEFRRPDHGWNDFRDRYSEQRYERRLDSVLGDRRASYGHQGENYRGGEWRYEPGRHADYGRYDSKDSVRHLDDERRLTHDRRGFYDLHLFGNERFEDGSRYSEGRQLSDERRLEDYKRVVEERHFAKERHHENERHLDEINEEERKLDEKRRWVEDEGPLVAADRRQPKLLSIRHAQDNSSKSPLLSEQDGSGHSCISSRSLDSGATQVAVPIMSAAEASGGATRRVRRVFEPRSPTATRYGSEGLAAATHGSHACSNEGPPISSIFACKPQPPETFQQQALAVVSTTRSEATRLPLPLKFPIPPVASSEIAPPAALSQVELHESLAARRERLSAAARPRGPEATTTDGNSVPPLPSICSSAPVAVTSPAPHDPALAGTTDPAVKPVPSSAVAESSKRRPEPSGPPEDESTHHWVSVHDSAGLWALAQQIGAAESMPIHPDVQPAPPGSLDLPSPVLTFAAIDESAAAREAADLDRAHVLNESLLRACWPPRCRIPSGRALMSSAETISGWAKLKATLSRRLVVVCGSSFAAMSEHPTVVEHMSLLVLVAALSDEACAARCGCDSLADLWDAMEEGCPLIFLEAPCSTRRARKQLLYKLSKQCVAVEYAWEALIGPSMADALENASTPALQEGWAAVLQ